MECYIGKQQYCQTDQKTAHVALWKCLRSIARAQLVNLLNGRDMRSIRGGKIALYIMNRLLKTRHYIDEYRYRDLVKGDGIPVIVPKELFEQARERLVRKQKGSRPSQSRRRLPFDNEAVLWEMRLLYGGRKRHKPYNESTPSLSLWEY